MLVETTYYILPMREIRTDGGVVCADPCKPDQAQFWGLYKLESDGCSEWVSDHPSLEAAEESIDRIQSATRLEPVAGTSALAFVPEPLV
jgi:hypothetical protein